MTEENKTADLEKVLKEVAEAPAATRRDRMRAAVSLAYVRDEIPRTKAAALGLIINGRSIVESQ